MNISLHDQNGGFLDTSREFLSFTGYSLEYLKKIDIYLLFHPDDRSRIWAESHSHLKEATKIIDYRFKLADGTYRWVRAHSYFSNEYGYIISYTEEIGFFRRIWRKLFLSYIHRKQSRMVKRARLRNSDT